MQDFRLPPRGGRELLSSRLLRREYLQFIADVSGQPIGPTFRVFLPLMVGPIGCPETSLRNYHNSLRNYPDEHSSQSHARTTIIEQNAVVVTSTNSPVVVPAINSATQRFLILD
jgi:hypothetical protein